MSPLIWLFLMLLFVVLYSGLGVDLYFKYFFQEFSKFRDAWVKFVIKFI